ncbi:MAG: hypothetical protein ACMUJM_14005 [bacterium]
MFNCKRLFTWKELFFIIFFSLMIISAPCLLHAQYWTALPPYNILWPLWSPALSPVKAVTGLATPLVNQLSNATVLPVQPVLAWDPAQQWAYAVYNIPVQFGGGLTYFSPYYGLNPWPPSSLKDSVTGTPIPLTLPKGYESLLPLDPQSQLPVFGGAANYAYLFQYSSPLFGIPLQTLLTISDIWGLPPL